MKLFGNSIKKVFNSAVRLLVCGALAGGLAGVADVASAEDIYISGATQKDTSWYGGNGETVVVGTDVTGNEYTTGQAIYGTAYGVSDAKGGNVIVNGGNIGGVVHGGMASGGVATNNTVTIKGGIVDTVYGAETSGIEDAIGNMVIINNGEITHEVWGGKGCNGKNNVVTINGGTIKGDVYSGVGEYNAENNVVTITGGTINRDVYSGHGKSVSEGNVINLVGVGGIMGNMRHNDDISIAGILYAGRAKPLIGSGTSSNNTLNIYGQGTKVGGIDRESTQNLNFYIQDGLKYGDTMLTVGSGVDLTGVNVGVNLQGVPTGDKEEGITLLHTTTGSITGITAGDVKVNKGTMTFEGSVSLEDSNKKLCLNVDELSGSVNENGKSLVETRAAAGAIVNSVSDFTVEQGMTQAKTAAKAGEVAGITEFVPFAAMGGSNMRYETGSYVDMKGWNVSVGLAKKVKDITFGVAVEHGTGNYDSYLDNGHHASGDIKATGGAIFAEQKKEDGIHWDATIRAGRTTTDYKNDADISYKDSANYYGFSFGGGKEFAVKNNSAVDFYGRFYFNHTNSSDTISSDGNYNHFDAVNSKRIRIGTRYTYTLNDKNKLYTGLAWQHEFDGDARATINGVGAPAPSLKGNSGMLEVGWKVQAAKNVTVDLNLTGWTGKQKGVTGGVGIQWTF